MRQKLLVVLTVAALVVTAGCTFPGGTTEKTSVHVSSQGEAVDDFRVLRLSITKVGVYQTDSDKWKTTSVTKFVDLTNVQGNKTAFVASMELPAGEYIIKPQAGESGPDQPLTPVGDRPTTTTAD